MRSAKDVPLHVLLRATKAVIDRILDEFMDGAPRVGHRTDHSDTVTGYKGVSAHLYTSPGDGRTVNLQVEGPEALIPEIVRLYGNTYKPWGRQPGKVLFEIRG